MRDEAASTRAGWAYMSVVAAIPGVDLSVRQALVLQFAVFEGAAIGLAAWYGLWRAVPFATVAILVATLGSGLMTRLHDAIQSLAPPDPYQQVLFRSSIDVVMGLVAFIAFVTYLLAELHAARLGFLERYLGPGLPGPAVFVALLIAWDLCYRIGTGWLASVTGLWRTVVFSDHVQSEDQTAYIRADLLTIVFAGLQLLLLPFLWPNRLLVVLVAGHVGAVLVVSTLSIMLQLSR